MAYKDVDRWGPDGPSAWDKTKHRLCMAAVSFWAAGVLGVLLTVLHLVWLWRSSHAGEVISGYGAALVVLGAFVAARPFMRRGIARTISPDLEKPYAPRGFEALAKRLHDMTELPNIRMDIIAERIIAVVLVVIGTLLNGYGTPLARLAGWPI